MYPTTSAPSTFGIKYAPLSALLNLILLFSPSAIRRLNTFVKIVATIANLNVKIYEPPTLESVNRSI